MIKIVLVGSTLTHCFGSRSFAWLFGDHVGICPCVGQSQTDALLAVMKRATTASACTTVSPLQLTLLLLCTPDVH